MSTATPAYDGITDEEQAALAELEAQINGASEDDPEFNPEETVKAGEVFGSDQKNQAEAEALEQEQQAAKTKEEEQAAADAKAKEEADAKAKADAEAAEGANKQQEQQAKPEPQQVREPVLVAQAPADADAKLAEIGTKKGELSKQFDDGDLTTAEYQAELDKLNREERAIERAVDRANLAAEMEEQRAVNERNAAINTFLTDVGIPFDPKNLRFQTLDAAVRIVANDEANANLSYAETMQKAYDLCVQEGTLQAKKAPAQEQQQQQEAKPAKKPIEAPPSLARMPAAETTDTEENRFAWLNNIKDPDKREREFAKMSAADQEAYMMTGG